MPHSRRPGPPGPPYRPAPDPLAGLFHGVPPNPPGPPPHPPHPPPDPAIPPLPPVPPHPPGPHPPIAPRVRRGDVRAAMLALLAEEPRNGYQIIQEIAARSGGIWRPSPGSVYPALQQLEDEGLVTAAESAGSRVYRLTDAGRAHVAERARRRPPVGGGGLQPARGPGRAAPAVGPAAARRSGSWCRWRTPGRRRRHDDCLRDTRRAIFRILADDDLETTDGN